MYKQGQLIAINGNIYEYVKYDDVANVYLVSEVGIDCDGMLTSTHILSYFYLEQFIEGYNEINLTKDQWYGVVAHIIRQNHDVTEEEIEEATEDIVGRCFRMNMPQFNELEDYIACYMNR